MLGAVLKQQGRIIEALEPARKSVQLAPEDADAHFNLGNTFKDLIPADKVYPYAVNTPLFSNYAEKARFIYLPSGKKMALELHGPVRFDDGAVLIKNFYYPVDQTSPNDERELLETRLLIKEKDGWKPLNYLWNEDQTDAILNYVGAKIDMNWTNKNGEEKKVVYQVPNLNQCKNCHNRNNKISPIGVTAAQLNRQYEGVEKIGPPHSLALKYYEDELNNLQYHILDIRIIF